MVQDAKIMHFTEFKEIKALEIERIGKYQFILILLLSPKDFCPTVKEYRI